MKYIEVVLNMAITLVCAYRMIYIAYYIHKNKITWLAFWDGEKRVLKLNCWDFLLIGMVCVNLFTIRLHDFYNLFFK